MRLLTVTQCECCDVGLERQKAGLDFVVTATARLSESLSGSLNRRPIDVEIVLQHCKVHVFCNQHPVM